MFSADTANGQEIPEAHKMENTAWHEVILIDFKSGKMDEAMDIIDNYFMKASEKAGLPGPAMELEMQTGKWDMMLVWDMDSISEMEWEVSPESEKFLKALSEQVGSFEKAQEIFSNYSSMISESTSFIATSDTGSE
jgi:hypothetical protein